MQDKPSFACAPALPPAPPRSVVVRVGDVEFVFRLGGILFFVALTVGLDTVFLPGLIFGPPTPSHLAAAVAVLPLLVATLVLHEGGHAMALYLQGYRPVRITLHAGGAACDAIVTRETPGESLVRALAGPAVTSIVTALLVLVWIVLPVPLLWSLIAKPVAIVGVVEGIVNTLPLHARSDGLAALRAFVWLVRGRPPSRPVVLYVWRPLALIALLIGVLVWGVATGHIVPGAPVFVGLVCGILALAAIPCLALAKQVGSDS